MLPRWLIERFKLRIEAEEVGVEHLLRDVKDMTISTLANQVAQKLASLKGLGARLQEVDAYLQNVLSGRMPVNHRIIYQLQDVFNLLPNLNVEELVKAFAVKTNDMMLAIYLSSVIRSTVALHNLIVRRSPRADCPARRRPRRSALFVGLVLRRRLDALRRITSSITRRRRRRLTPTNLRRPTPRRPTPRRQKQPMGKRR